MLAMRSSSASPPRKPPGCPVCGCDCRSPPSAASRRPLLSPKRKTPDPGGSDDVDDLDIFHLASPSPPARVGAEDERVALRRALLGQYRTIEDLQRELEEERSASSTAANEAMSMILRLQREKAEIQMEARQFKQFAEDKIAHDQQQIATLEEECYRREQAINAMLFEVQAFRSRLLSCGIDPSSGAMEIDENYPQLRCLLPDASTGMEMVEKYAAGDTPRTPGGSIREQLMDIEQRIGEMERAGSGCEFHVTEKAAVWSSPRARRHSRRISVESVGSFLMPEIVQEQGIGWKMEMVEDEGEDDVSDRVYTIDAIHGVQASRGTFDDYLSTPRGSVVKGNMGIEDTDIKKLYMRLQTLEADRESLKQAIASMRTEKAQMVLLKEIAQNLSKGLVVAQPLPERNISRKPFFFGLFSFLSVLKHVLLFAFGTESSTRSRYMFHLVNGRVGLLILLDRSQVVRHWRFVTRPIGGGESSKIL